MKKKILAEIDRKIKEERRCLKQKNLMNITKFGFRCRIQGMKEVRKFITKLK